MKDQQLEELIALTKSFKSDVDRRYDELNKKLESINKRFEVDKRERVDLRHLLHREQTTLQKIYDSKDNVAVRFTRVWVIVSILIAVASAAIVFILSDL